MIDRAYQRRDEYILMRSPRTGAGDRRQAPGVARYVRGKHSILTPIADRPATYSFSNTYFVLDLLQLVLVYESAYRARCRDELSSKLETLQPLRWGEAAWHQITKTIKCQMRYVARLEGEICTAVLGIDACVYTTVPKRLVV